MKPDQLDNEYSPKAAQRTAQQHRERLRQHESSHQPITDPDELAAHVRRLNAALAGRQPPRRRRNKGQS